MRSNLVYDIPTRIFHWLFAGLFVFAFAIGKTVDDESFLFSYHMLAGLILGGLVVWRVFWGFLGSRHARFSEFSLNLVDLKNYFQGMVSGSKKRWAGHNPASSWAAVVMLMLGLGLAVTGYLMSTGLKEELEDVHELMANGFVLIAVLHVVGVLLHSIRHQDFIALSMVDGKKQLDSKGEFISSQHGFAAIFLVAIVASAGILVVKNFDPQSRTLKVFGQTLQLGENEQEEHEQEEHEQEEEQSAGRNSEGRGSDGGSDHKSQSQERDDD